MSLALEQIGRPALSESVLKMNKCSVVLGSVGQFGGVLSGSLLCKLSQLTLELSLFFLWTSILYPAPRHSRTAP
jgi:hypothetical protein